MRRASAILITIAAVAGLAGCGTDLPLPTERSGALVPSDKSYAMEATWTGMTDVRDILLTQSTGTQLFVLFNHGGTGAGVRGEVHSYARLRATGPQTPLPDIDFPTLFNPVALASGGDGLGGANNRVFVLDRGDTCMARQNPRSGSCTDTSGGWTNRVSHLEYFWRVREFGLLGRDTLSTFTDTSMAFVSGIAADALGRVYVAGAAIARVQDTADPRLFTWTYVWRVNRYLRGQRYPGVNDPYMPGTRFWHRDTTWLVRDGSGIGSVVDPRGLFWGTYGSGGLYTSDFGKSWVQEMSDVYPSTGLLRISAAADLDLSGPLDVVADKQGFIYVVDSGNKRVLRFDSSGEYVQSVDVEKDAFGRSLLDPVAVAADDSLVFVGDAGLAEVIRYKRRP
jgi:DNA-binding beta-propeller fold protein YncE